MSGQQLDKYILLHRANTTHVTFNDTTDVSDDPCFAFSDCNACTNEYDVPVSGGEAVLGVH